MTGFIDAIRIGVGILTAIVIMRVAFPKQVEQWEMKIPKPAETPEAIAPSPSPSPIKSPAL